MVGLVLVSHSGAIADGAAELARQMAGADIAIEPAGGLEDGTIGTDAVRIAAAIERAWSDDGVLVLMDLGSAVLSTEMALELLGDGRRDRVRLTAAALVEGAVAAAVAARAGFSLDAVADEASGGLVGKAAHLGEGSVATGSTVAAGSGSSDVAGAGPVERVVITMTLPHGLHARPAARLVQVVAASGATVQVANATTGRGPVSARSLNAVATLGILKGQELEVTATGPGAAGAISSIVALAGRDFDERTEVRAPMAAPVGDIPEGAIIGMPAAPGVVVAPIRHAVTPTLVPTTDERAARSPSQERAALTSALTAAAAEIGAQRDEVVIRSGSGAAAIFDAHLLFLEDAAILEPASSYIDKGADAANAWHRSVEDAARTWESLEDPYLRARAADLRAVGTRVLAHLLGVAVPSATISARGILVAEDLSPSDAATLDPSFVVGVATSGGGPTSHASLLTRSLGIPAVVGLGPRIAAVPEGSELALDGDAGYVIPDPRAEVRELFALRAEEASEFRARAAESAGEPGVTADGVAVEVSANVGTPDEVTAAMAAGCDGVGLFRTEILFLGRSELPGEEEQAAAYRRAAELLEGRPLIIRTLDIGADKPLAALRQDPEANPFLGLRGLRLGLARPDLLDVQLRAIARVAADHRVRVMFPMVSTLDELLAARAALARARDAVGGGEPEVGIMIEVPAAALAADRLAPHVDFFSIGTNDLTQYVFAAERGNERVARLADPFHPAVLELIGRTARAANVAGRWTGVCGEFAADPRATALLVGLGVRELSMGAPSIPLVKQALRDLTIASAEALAEHALTLASGAEVRELVAPAG